ncbi:MAG: hypothetical protein GF381_03930 [Candidatus Pacebacteria bacterium]|nr:hypothetical protein [Candidatus Paceibacterota bacterium]
MSWLKKIKQLGFCRSKSGSNSRSELGCFFNKSGEATQDNSTKCSNWVVWILLALILLLATVVRFYNLPNNFMFEGDQGRDALLVSKIFKEKDLVFIGPVTSVGNMYLGPLYYYFMLPFLWLSYPSPLGPVYAVAVLGVLTVFLTYYFGKKMFGQGPGLLAAFLMAISSAAVTYSRFSWNPNLAPLFGLLLLYFNWKALRQPKNWIWVATCFAFLIQLHYLTLLSLAGIGLSWLWQLVVNLRGRSDNQLNQDRSKVNSKNKQTELENKQQLNKIARFISRIESIFRNGQLVSGNEQRRSANKQLRAQLIYSGLGILVLFVSLTPLILFDYKHDWLNFKAFGNLLLREPNFVQAQQSLPILTKLKQILFETDGRAMHILFEFGIGQIRRLNRFLVVITFLGLTLSYLRFSSLNQKGAKQAVGLLFVYLLTAVVGTATYQHTIFDHYIAYLFPFTFFAYGLVLWLLARRWLTAFLALAFIVFFLQFNLPRLPLEYGGSIHRTRQTARAISQKLNPNEKYNLVLLSETQDIVAQKYRYFLSTTNNPPLKQDQRGQGETLVIINEQHLTKPIDLPIYEIVVFPDKKIDLSFPAPGGEEILILRKN